MKINKIHTLTALITLMGLFATLSGLLDQNTYINDSLSATAQMMGQDLVTLTTGIPLLIISAYLSRSSAKARLLWMGGMFYFTYTYASMAFLASYNSLFLLYVGILALSLYGLMGELFTTTYRVNVDEKKSGFTAIYLTLTGLMLAAMWIKMITDSLITGMAPGALEGYTTLVIQALDLGVVVPAALLTSYFLLKREVWGYILAPVFLVKVSLLGTAILSMVAFMAMEGVPFSWGQAAFFMVLTFTGLAVTGIFYRGMAITSGRLTLDEGYAGNTG